MKTHPRRISINDCRLVVQLSCVDVIRLIHPLRAAVHSHRDIRRRRASITSLPSYPKGSRPCWRQQRTGRSMQSLGHLLLADLVPDCDVVISLNGGTAFTSEQCLHLNWVSFRWVGVLTAIVAIF
jgi:hypothetical protein